MWTVKDGYTIPWGTAATETHQVTLDETVCYTDYAGKLLNVPTNESGYWKTADNTLCTATSVFAQDTALTTVALGDVDLSGAVDLNDVIRVLQHLVGYTDMLPANALADMNKDTRVSIYDAVLVLKKAS